jgi:hypothetical protein
MKQRTLEILTVIAIILLNFWLMSGGHGGRGQDYYEDQTEYSFADE